MRSVEKGNNKNQRGYQQIMIIDKHSQNSMEAGMKYIGSANNQDAHNESPETLESKQERMARKFGLGLDDIARGQNLSSQLAVPSTLHHSLDHRSARDYTLPGQESPSEHTRVQSNKLWELTKDAEHLALTGSLQALLARPMTERQRSLPKVQSSPVDSPYSSMSKSLPSNIETFDDPKACSSSKTGKPKRRNGAKDKTLTSQKFKVSWDKFPTDFPESNIKPTMSTEHFLDGLELFTTSTTKKTNILDLMRRELDS
jgi:hypothetical protein